MITEKDANLNTKHNWGN